MKEGEYYQHWIIHVYHLEMPNVPCGANIQMELLDDLISITEQLHLSNTPTQLALRMVNHHFVVQCFGHLHVHVYSMQAFHQVHITITIL